MNRTRQFNRGFLGFLFVLMTGLVLTTGPFSLAVANEDNFYGAKNVKGERTYSLEEMLNYAIEDEYKARAEYELIISEMDGGRPFTNIVAAEKKHISLLEPLFEKYEIDIPEDRALEHTVLPESIQSALEIGVRAEVDNIAMYEKFLSQDLPSDIEEVFLRLKKGSENHLEAFKRASSSDGKQNILRKNNASEIKYRNRRLGNGGRVRNGPHWESDRKRISNDER